MKILRTTVILASCLFAPRTVRAQTAVYGTLTVTDLYNNDSYNGVAVNPSSLAYTFGPTFGIYSEIPIPVVKLGIDVRGVFNAGSSSHYYAGIVEPRLALDLKKVKSKPYIEGGPGFGSYLRPSSPKSESGTTYGFSTGVDYTIHPHFDWRVFEYAWNSGPSGYATRSFSSGIVFRIP